MLKTFSSLVLCGFFFASCVSQKPEESTGASTQQAPPATYPDSTVLSAEDSPGETENSEDSPAPAKPAGRQKTFSGLQYEVLKYGTGSRPTSFNRVKVHYHGYLPDGTVFDSSVERGQPSTFGLNQVIAGWKEGIALMQEGAKYRFTIPPHLAYGERGMPPKIGPNQTLMFDVELIEVIY